jgi:hypothetical protein
MELESSTNDTGTTGGGTTAGTEAPTGGVSSASDSLPGTSGTAQGTPARGLERLKGLGKKGDAGAPGKAAPQAQAAPVAKSTATTPEELAQAAKAQPPAGGIQAAVAAAAAGGFQPNFKFKYLGADGKQVEAEMDAVLREAIKDPDSEKAVRDLVERAYGLDYAKASRSKVTEENTQLRSHLGQVNTQLSTLGGHLQKKDYGSFFKALNVPDEDIVRYAVDLVDILKDPSKKAARDAAYTESVRVQELTQQNQQLQTQYADAGMQMRQLEIQQVFAHPSVAPLATDYDAQLGEGAFLKAVIKRGGRARGAVRRGATCRAHRKRPHAGARV